MSRPLRIQYPGAIYHVMNRGSCRTPIFLNPHRDRNLFLSVLGDAHRLWKIKVHAYSLMDNHYHLLMETPLPNLSRAMRHIDGVYTQRFNKIHGRDGALLRGRFKSKLVQRETYFLELVRYIHLNGMKALKYPAAQFDPFSSYCFYMNPLESPPFLSQETVLSFFGNDPSDAREKLAEFVRQGVPKGIQDILDRKRWPAIFGTVEFIDEIKERFFKGKEPHQEKPQEKNLLKPGSQLTPLNILNQVASAYDQSVDGITQLQSTKSNEARKVAMYFLRFSGGLGHREIGIMMGGISYAAVSMACKDLSWLKSEKFEDLKKVLV